MLNYDFTPLSRSFIGFDRMAELIEGASKLNAGGTYPPYNVARISEDAFQIELAVAGFGEQDLSLKTHENVLTVVGSKAANENQTDEHVQYLHRGIAERGFERRFQLADHVIVTGADLANGMLRIDLRRELPEAMKPRNIAIGSSQGNTLNTQSKQSLTSETPSRKSKAA